MTREENIKWLKSLKAEIGKSEHRALWHYAEAIDMAIEALSNYTTKSENEAISGTNDAVDLISRADARAACSCLHPEDCWEAINALPTADRPHGEWIYSNNEPMYWGSYGGYCTNCGSYSEYLTGYCGECGAIMSALNDDDKLGSLADMRGGELELNNVKVTKQKEKDYLNNTFPHDGDGEWYDLTDVMNKGE